MAGRRRTATMVRDAEALRMHLAGDTLQDICDHFSWKSHAAAHQAIRRAVADSYRLPKAEAIKAEEERLDLLSRTFTQLMLNEGEDPQIIIAAGLALLKVSESRRKMLGWDAPTRTRIDVVPEEAVDERIATLETRKLELAASNGHRTNGHKATG